MKFLQPGTISDRIFMGAATLTMWCCGFVLLYLAIFKGETWGDFLSLSVVGVGAIYASWMFTFGLGILPYVFKNRPL